MELKAYFSDIHRAIIGHLERAQSQIVAAVAWFTDSDIFEVLCKKAQLGAKVSVALIGDEINQGPGRLNFQRLQELGGQVIFLPSENGAAPLMHHKFCVIDGATVITGSYNWSRKARSNDENITVVTDSESFASKYLDAFEDLLARAGQLGGSSVSDPEAVQRRLELIRNLILLGERDEIASHIRKLRVVTGLPVLNQFIEALEGGKYKAALEMIEEYLTRTNALIVADDAEINRLRFELFTLEIRLESLSDEKAELERRLITFNRRHDEALGDLIKGLLRARAELAQLTAERQHEAAASEQAKVDARDAEEDYNSYSRQHEEMQREVPLPKLDDDAERELKLLFRKACSLCHPDKLPEERKAEAHLAFIELKDAYERNDLPRVREIHASLLAGGAPATRSTTLRIVDDIKAAIAEMDHSIARTLMELKALRGSDAGKRMESAGDSERDWQAYFDRQSIILDEELARLVSCIADARRQEEGASMPKEEQE